MLKRYAKKKKYPCRRRPKFDPQTIDRARTLQSKHGLPFSMAMRVALGQMSLSAVLDRMVRKRDIAKLVQKYKIPPSVAGQVLDGRISLEKYLRQHRQKQERASRPSIIDIAKGAQRDIGVMIDPDKMAVGKVIKCSRYQIDFVTREGETLKALHKTSLHFAFRGRHFDAIRRVMAVDEKIYNQNLAPEKSMRLRRQYKSAALQKLQSSKAKVAITTRRGYCFKGIFRWFNKFEIGIQLEGGGPQIVFFRHAIHRIETASGEEIPGRIAGQKPSGNMV
mgnify:CR=1 FL=1